MSLKKSVLMLQFVKSPCSFYLLRCFCFLLCCFLWSMCSREHLEASMEKLYLFSFIFKSHLFVFVRLFQVFFILYSHYVLCTFKLILPSIQSTRHNNCYSNTTLTTPAQCKNLYVYVACFMAILKLLFNVALNNQPN